MRKIAIVMTVVFALLGAGAWAQEEIVERAVEACQMEIENYCSQVTPGDGRLLACFYAHQDKLSSRCEYGLYEASAELEQFAAAITHLASACIDDLEKFCAEVEMGEGRVASCLLDNKAELSETCTQAIDDVGLEVVEEE